jgi:hypothetical protein
MIDLNPVIELIRIVRSYHVVLRRLESQQTYLDTCRKLLLLFESFYSAYPRIIFV